MIQIVAVIVIVSFVPIKLVIPSLFKIVPIYLNVYSALIYATKVIALQICNLKKKSIMRLKEKLSIGFYNPEKSYPFMLSLDGMQRYFIDK